MIKPGSIVVCQKAEIDPVALPHVRWLPVMDEETPYMIREVTVHKNKSLYVSFEEGIIGIHEGLEIIFPECKVREILPPEEMKIEMLIEEEMVV